MKKWMIATLVSLMVGHAYSQQVADLEEGIPYANNGLEYGFYITNEGSKEVKGEDYERFEVNLYVTNKSGCIKLIPFKSGWFGNNPNNNNDEVMVAEYNCTNATGKRLTAKKGAVNAKPFYTYARVRDEAAKDKYRNMNVQVGYAIRNGQTLTNRMIVIVPKGERPKMNCRVIYIPDI